MPVPAPGLELSVAKSVSGRSEPMPAYRLIGRREIALNLGSNLIGRDQESIVWIDEESVSRRHALIAIDEGGATVRDLGARTGPM